MSDIIFLSIITHFYYSYILYLIYDYKIETLIAAWAILLAVIVVSVIITL